MAHPLTIFVVDTSCLIMAMKQQTKLVDYRKWMAMGALNPKCTGNQREKLPEQGNTSQGDWCLEDTCNHNHLSFWALLNLNWHDFVNSFDQVFSDGNEHSCCFLGTRNQRKVLNVVEFGMVEGSHFYDIILFACPFNHTSIHFD